MPHSCPLVPPVYTELSVNRTTSAPLLPPCAPCLYRTECEQDDQCPTLAPCAPSTNITMSGQEQQCPTCGHSFKMLSRHKCKGPVPVRSPPSSTPLSGTQSLVKASPVLSSGGEQACPTCGRMFKQLWQHKCHKGQDSSSPPAAAGVGGMRSSTSVSDDRSCREEQMRPTCGKMFKQLWRHECKGPPSASSRPSAIVGEFQPSTRPSPDHNYTQ